MKIDNVYVVRLFIISSKSYKLELGAFDYLTRFLKWTMVYNKDNDFIDLRTGKKYKVLGSDACFYPGDIIIDPEAEVLPFRQIVNQYNDDNKCNIKVKDSMSKRKILKLFDNGGKNEKNI